MEKIVEILKKKGFVITRTPGLENVVDFIHKRDLEKLRMKEIWIPYFKSSIACRDEYCQANLQKTIFYPNESVEVYFPEGVEVDRVHMLVHWLDKVARLGVVMRFKKEKAEEVLTDFFGI